VNVILAYKHVNIADCKQLRNTKWKWFRM